MFEPTLNMINKDFTEFPEHRVGFYKLLRSINTCCFEGMSLHVCLSISRLNHSKALLGLPSSQLKLLMDSVIWAIKHTMRDIADMGLSRAILIIIKFSIP